MIAEYYGHPRNEDGSIRLPEAEQDGEGATAPDTLQSELITLAKFASMMRAKDLEEAARKLKEKYGRTESRRPEQGS